jgi:hypothetical protein
MLSISHLRNHPINKTCLIPSQYLIFEQSSLAISNFNGFIAGAAYKTYQKLPTPFDFGLWWK